MTGTTLTGARHPLFPELHPNIRLIQSTLHYFFVMTNALCSVNSPFLQYGKRLMSIRISIFAATLIGLSSSLFSVPVHAQVQHPACLSASSDSDNDGFGWENRTTCVVTTATSPEPADPICIDDDGDGYGWDGSKVCALMLCATTQRL